MKSFTVMPLFCSRPFTSTRGAGGRENRHEGAAVDSRSQAHPDDPLLRVDGRCRGEPWIVNAVRAFSVPGAGLTLTRYAAVDPVLGVHDVEERFGEVVDGHTAGLFRIVHAHAGSRGGKGRDKGGEIGAVRHRDDDCFRLFIDLPDRLWLENGKRRYCLVSPRGSGNADGHDVRGSGAILGAHRVGDRRREIVGRLPADLPTSRSGG